MYLQTSGYTFNQMMGLIQIFILFGCFLMFVWILLAMSVFCFSMIHVLPERIIRWVGIEPDESTRVASQALSSVRQGVRKAGSELGQAGSSTAQSLSRLPEKAWTAPIKEIPLPVEKKAQAEQEGTPSLTSGDGPSSSTPNLSAPDTSSKK